MQVISIDMNPFGSKFSGSNIHSFSSFGCLNRWWPISISGIRTRQAQVASPHPSDESQMPLFVRQPMGNRWETAMTFRLDRFWDMSGRFARLQKTPGFSIGWVWCFIYYFIVWHWLGQRSRLAKLGHFPPLFWDGLSSSRMFELRLKAAMVEAGHDLVTEGPHHYFPELPPWNVHEWLWMFHCSRMASYSDLTVAANSAIHMRGSWPFFAWCLWRPCSCQTSRA